MNTKPLIIGNWKMTLTPSASQRLARSLALLVSGIETKKMACTLVLAPSFESIPIIRSVLEGTPISLCAQDCFWEQKGAYTGEVSPTALHQSGCSYVLIGHSERRIYAGESDHMIAKKVAGAYDTRGLQPVLCVGEPLAVRRAGKHFLYLRKQLERGLLLIPRTVRGTLIIAYEPLWAISTMGTGRLITTDDCKEVKTWMTTYLNRRFPSARIMVLYGGSVDSKNIMPFLSRTVSDGVLVGGASSRRTEMQNIIKKFIEL